MSESCSHDCASCSQDCAARDLRLPANQYSTVKHVIGVVSGKGGVGKSTVTAMLAVAAQAQGFQTAILDADVTGPSIPKMFGLHGRAEGSADGIFPMETKTGIRVMSVNLLLEKEDAPVIWRGPVISGMIQQFWQEVIWGDVDYMFVDMPPGTGDVPLTVFQSLPLDGINALCGHVRLEVHVFPFEYLLFVVLQRCSGISLDAAHPAAPADVAREALAEYVVADYFAVDLYHLLIKVLRCPI